MHYADFPKDHHASQPERDGNTRQVSCLSHILTFRVLDLADPTFERLAALHNIPGMLYSPGAHILKSQNVNLANIALIGKTDV